jgi:hypothetical protein
MSIRCVIACYGADDAPTFFGYAAKCTEAEYEDGRHYDKACEAAADARHSGPFVMFDEHDGPAWLFAHVFQSAD